MAGSQCGNLLALQPSISGTLRHVAFGPVNGRWSRQISKEPDIGLLYGAKYCLKYI